MGQNSVIFVFRDCQNHVFWWDLDAISGTTPPNFLWSICEEIILDFIFPLEIIDADVSSHEVSIANIVLFILQKYIYFCDVSRLIASYFEEESPDNIEHYTS